MKVRQPKKHRHHRTALNKLSLPQGQRTDNNQKELKRSEEMTLALVVLEKNTNIVMVDEKYYFANVVLRELNLEAISKKR